MDPSISFIANVAAALNAALEFVGKNALILVVYTAIIAFAARLINKASREFTIRGEQVADFFRMSEK